MRCFIDQITVEVISVSRRDAKGPFRGRLFVAFAPFGKYVEVVCVFHPAWPEPLPQSEPAFAEVSSGSASLVSRPRES